MAHSLDVALAGPRSYQGQFQDFAWVNENGSRLAAPDDIERAVRLLWSAWALILVFVLGLFLL